MQPSTTFTRRSGTALEAIDLGRNVYPRLRFSVVVMLMLFFSYCMYRLTIDPAGHVLWAVLIAICALVPSIAWASGYVGGLPIFPVHAATLVLTYALPLVSGHPEVASADPGDVSDACVGIVLYAVVASAIWYVFLHGKNSGQGPYRVLPVTRGFYTLLGLLFVGAIYNILLMGGWLNIPMGLYSVVRALSMALTSIAMFVLGVRLGGSALTPGQRVAALAVTGLYILTQFPGLYLGAPVISALSIMAGYAIGGARIPWISVIVGVLAVGVLQAGKFEMRENYWSGEGAGLMSVWEVPGFVVSWFGAGITAIGSEREKGQPISERLSLLHLLMLAQRSTTHASDFLDGETYALIPRTLLPRFIDPDKPSSGDATNILSQHFGLQSLSDQEGTQIAWGIVAESYANFGAAGIVVLGVVIGVLLGLATRITVGAPFMSLHNFLGILILVIFMQTELTMVILVTATLQASASLLLLWPFCSPQRAPERA
jgi:hypothetical protein